MPTELPIACSLWAAELAARLAEMESLGRAALIDAQASERRALLSFRGSAEVRERLAAIVAAEAECCAFLTMTLGDSAGARVTLSIEGPPGAEPVIKGLVAAFAG